MTVFTNFLRSLLLTMFFSFITPMFLIGGLLFLLALMGHFPALQGGTDATSTGIMHFLFIFGSGNPFRGLVIISLTCSFVGALFDTYAYYRCQILRIDS
ncbi:hypothetical protein [Umezakia ovalisporum]|jgi:hypothetical protein|uniref:hypothetical protein n=1 Tax=Umezakia ovalisporum TaxID=75695 RepID=UPI000A7B5DFF|nr:hypothetical protein [Umezakia ovalisporum]MBI1240615.1 hypothetical protein [Nostoc sp. RI_552]MDH6085699.1 hypothetical protein [Umezakia ovalisporum TAC611]MDH6089124.1 hypothetical protein [Umezakia ovalisporum Ak1311]